MARLLLVNKTPIDRNRLYLFLSLAVLGTCLTVYQVSDWGDGWVSLHENAPSIIFLEFFPVLLIFFIWFITRKKFSEEAEQIHEDSKVKLNTRIAAILNKLKSDQYDPASDITEEEIIDTALREIHEKFKKDADQSGQRRWTNEGLAILREIMGSHSEVKPMSEELISRLIKYIGANQGGAFVLNDQQDLELIACYAFERKKFLHKIVSPGQGLVGQCYLERHPIFLTNVPNDYVNITSGLGIANPQCIFIVPLNVKDSTIGVLEIASFKPFKKYERDFIERVAEAFGQSISTIKVSEDTKTLLTKSLSREQEMKDQEERMRQNLEELYVTQEDMRKVNLEMEELFKAINALAETVELNRSGNITKLNDRFLQTLGFTAQDLYGKPIAGLLDKEENGVGTFEDTWKKVIEGQTQERVYIFTDSKKNKRWLRTGFYPLQGKDGIERILVFLYDITEIKTKEIQLDSANQDMESTRKMLIRILNEIPLKVFLKQYNGKFFVVNDTVSRFHGFDSPEGLIGKSDSDFYEADVAAEWLEAEHKIIAGGRTEYVHEDGGKILQTVKMPFYIDPLQETGLLGLQADVTELEMLRKEKKQRLRQEE